MSQDFRVEISAPRLTVSISQPRVMAAVSVGGPTVAWPPEVTLTAAQSPHNINEDFLTIYCDASAGDIVVNFPPLSARQRYSISKIDESAGRVMIYPQGEDTIAGNEYVDLRYQFENLEAVSGPGYWRIV